MVIIIQYLPLRTGGPGGLAGSTVVGFWKYTYAVRISTLFLCVHMYACVHVELHLMFLCNLITLVCRHVHTYIHTYVAHLLNNSD